MVELKKVDALSAAKVYVLTIMLFLLLGFLLNLAVFLAGGDLTEVFLSLVQIVFAFIGTFIGAKIFNILISLPLIYQLSQLLMD